MNCQFHGYTIRPAEKNDAALAQAWFVLDPWHREAAASQAQVQAAGQFWVRQRPGRVWSYFVEKDDTPLAFWQLALSPISAGGIGLWTYDWKSTKELYGVDPVEHDDEYRFYFQSAPFTENRGRKILRGITKLMPLIEKALALRGAKRIFFTSRSLPMIAFMERRLNYRLAANGNGPEGAVMFKNLSPEPRVASPEKNLPAQDSGLRTQDSNNVRA